MLNIAKVCQNSSAWKVLQLQQKIKRNHFNSALKKSAVTNLLFHVVSNDNISVACFFLTETWGRDAAEVNIVLSIMHEVSGIVFSLTQTLF